MVTKVQMRRILDTFEDMFPDAHCELTHTNPFELTIAVLLSAQCTDALVNKVTPGLFKKYKTPEDYLAVPLEELEQDIRSIGLYRNKAKNIQKLARMLLEDYGGEVPTEHSELVKLPGVGRKNRQRSSVHCLRHPRYRGRYACGARIQTSGHCPLEGQSSSGRGNLNEESAA